VLSLFSALGSEAVALASNELVRCGRATPSSFVALDSGAPLLFLAALGVPDLGLLLFLGAALGAPDLGALLLFLGEVLAAPDLGGLLLRRFDGLGLLFGVLCLAFLRLVLPAVLFFLGAAGIEPPALGAVELPAMDGAAASAGAGSAGASSASCSAQSSSMSAVGSAGFEALPLPVFPKDPSAINL
jgi:hypothetical protein